MPEEHMPNADDWFRYALALEASEEGFFDLDMVADLLWASARFRSITGLCDTCSTRDAWLDRVHPHDKPRLESELGSLREGKTRSIANEHRVRNADNS